MPPRTRTAARTVDWFDAEPASIVLVTGPEELLAERAVARVVQLARSGAPGAELVRLEAGSGYRPGALAAAAGPSLFAETAIVTVSAVAEATDDFLADALAYLGVVEPAAVVVLRHAGGPRGRKLLDAVRAAGYPEVACPALSRDAERMGFASGEFRRAGRQVAADALRALMDAVGSDLRELSAAIGQLVDDTTGRITRADVDRYYGGRLETTGFKVADAAIAGETGTALTLARHAMSSGADPVWLVATLAAKLRTLAKVGGARRRGLDPVRDLGLVAWQVDRAKRELRAWDAPRLGAAIRAVARADAEVKGASRDPRYALERAIVAVAEAAGTRGRR
jgi:DNA polymerase-3 subunit delta